MSIPKVVVAYFHRPMCVGLFFRHAFAQAGTRVLSAGPFTPTVYEHKFPAEDWDPPDIVLPNQPVAWIEFERRLALDGIRPDLVVMVDQYDAFTVYGSPPPGVRFAHVAVENFDAIQRMRYEQRANAHEYYMIAHSDAVKFLPPGAQWLPFGADPFIHRALSLDEAHREKLICQIGREYAPRPQWWNYLRRELDGEPEVRADVFHEAGPIETASTIFGHAPSYRQTIDAYNRSLVALSRSTVDFIPMRVPEAFGYGTLLLSDDVPALRKLFGPPYQEAPNTALWFAYDGSVEDCLWQLRYVRELPVTERARVRMRAYATVMTQHLYYHRALKILEDVGIKGADRLVIR